MVAKNVSSAYRFPKGCPAMERVLHHSPPVSVEVNPPSDLTMVLVDGILGTCVAIPDGVDAGVGEFSGTNFT
jgi:hypothetical protein